eukprot:SAG11_NODE_4847_length_1747_cov_17.033374_2_plen_120_part_00
MGSGGSFSVVHDELIISGADTGSGGNLTAFSDQLSQGEGGGAGYPIDHHSDKHSNPIADSLPSGGAEDPYQIFTGERISSSLQNRSLVLIICSPDFDLSCVSVCLRFRNGLRFRQQSSF